MDPVEKCSLGTKIVEEQLDATGNVDSSEMDYRKAICRKIIAQIYKDARQKKQWVLQGHGEYINLTSEEEFFQIVKKSENFVLHCYRTSTMRCSIVDKHLDLLAKKHIETKFCKLDIVNAPRICECLEVVFLPTLILFKMGHIIDFIVGFDELGGVDDFSTEILEQRLAQSGVVNVRSI